MIYMIGGAGAPNYGDELIVRSWLEYLSEECQSEKLWVESHNLTVSSFLNSESNAFAQFINPLRTIARDKRGLGFWEQLSRGWSYGSSSTHDHEKLYSLTINVIKSCRLIHIVGGGYIHTNSEGSGFLVGVAAGLSKRFRIPLYGTGLGLMPMNTATVRRQSIWDHLSLFLRDTFLPVLSPV